MPATNGKIVFFAAVSEDMKPYKEILVRELEHHGCIIKETGDSNTDTVKIREIIEQCDLAIHILSNSDPELSTVGKGMEELQIHLSVQHFISQKLVSDTPESAFKIFAWHPKSASESIFKEESIAEHLKKIQQLEEVEFLRTNFEDFKSYLLNKIEIDTNEVIEEFYIKGNENLSVYFLYDLIDKNLTQDYIDYLGLRGYTVFTPLFDNDILKVRQTHTNYLSKFDIAIIFANQASVNWLNMKIMDILKSPGLGRVKKILGNAIITSGDKVKSVSTIGGGFYRISSDEGTPKSQIDEFLHNLSY